jgi:hypothetical protein
MVEIKESCDVIVDDQNDVASATTISTIRSTKWNKLLTVNGDATISPAASRSVQCYTINECGHLHYLLFFFSKIKQKRVRSRGPAKEFLCELGDRNNYRDDVDDLTSTSLTELNCACSESKECVIFSDANILSRVENCSALADQDLTALYYLTTKTLDAEVLSI